MSGARGRIPRILLIAMPIVLAALLQMSPGLAARAQLDLTALAAGQTWRAFTGHFAHFSPTHFAWSGGAFAVLWAMAVVGAGAPRAVACLGLSSLAVAIAAYAGTSLETYRGLSGVDSALFVFVAVHALARAVREREIPRAAGLVVCLGALGAKLWWEMPTGGSMFVPAAGDVVPVPIAHVAGAVTGMACAVWTVCANARAGAFRNWRSQFSRDPEGEPQASPQGSASNCRRRPGHAQGAGSFTKRGRNAGPSRSPAGGADACPSGRG